MSPRDPSAVDPKAIIRTTAYRRLLLLACLTGFVISLAAWAFLTLVPWIQDRVYMDLPKALGFSEAPSWWPLPVLAIAGLITAFAIAKLPGRGGRVPAEGFAAGVTEPANLPGILLAGLSALGLGLVLGPSMPVIALGSGLGVLAVRTARSDAPDTTIMVMSAAGSCASLAMVFGSPVISAVILIEAAGLGGATLPLILLPGLLAAGIGSLVYLGMGQLTGLSTSAYALNPLELAAMPQLTVVDVLWTLGVAVLAALVTFALVQLARRIATRVQPRPFLLVPLAGLLVAGLAIRYAQVGDQTFYAVLFSGSRALDPVIQQAGTLSVATLALLLACKGLAWGVSMGSFRGGPVFPAIFVGTVGGLLASHLPGFPEGAAVATVMAATVAAVLRLPLASVVIALTLSSSAGADATPLIIRRSRGLLHHGRCARRPPRTTSSRDADGRRRFLAPDSLRGRPAEGFDHAPRLVEMRMTQPNGVRHGLARLQESALHVLGRCQSRARRRERPPADADEIIKRNDKSEIDGLRAAEAILALLALIALPFTRGIPTAQSGAQATPSSPPIRGLTRVALPKGHSATATRKGDAP